MRFAATPPIDGTLTRFYKLPEDLCYKLPQHMSLQEGALMEPTAVAVHVCRQAEVKPRDSLVVFGAGPIGLLCCAVGKAFGASKIVCVDINEERLKFAADYTKGTGTYVSQRIAAEENAKKIIEQFDLGEGADAVIDATGAEPCIQTCVHVLRKGGTYCQAGMVSTFHGGWYHLPNNTARDHPTSPSPSARCAGRSSLSVVPSVTRAATMHWRSTSSLQANWT
jgi:D-xylulose reductase